MPARLALKESDLDAVAEVFEYYRNTNEDPGYQGYFEKKYTDAFVRYMGGAGYADAICTGTAALFVAVASLQLNKGDHVMVSPITDPGTLNAIILNQLTPVLVDSSKGSYSISADDLEKRITEKARALLLVHSAGEAAEMEKICRVARKCNLKIVEDCSQAHGAEYMGQKVGTFGDIGVFSTMHTKSHSTGGCGGVAFTRNRDIYNLIRAYADRGKPFHSDDFDAKNPSTFMFPALNLNIDEISCALGCKSLERLDSVIEKRTSFFAQLKGLIHEQSQVFSLYDFRKGFSPFFIPIIVDLNRMNCSKIELAAFISEKGVSIRPHYYCVVSEWEWIKPYMSDDYKTPNAVAITDRSFNLLFNEAYSLKEAHFICEVFLEAERLFSKV